MERQENPDGTFDDVVYRQRQAAADRVCAARERKEQERRAQMAHASAKRRVGCRTSYAAGVRVSSKGDYACRALLSLALHDQELGPTSVRDIAELCETDEQTIQDLMDELLEHDLVHETAPRRAAP